MDSFDKEPDIGRPNMRETGREDGELQSEELEALLQKVEEKLKKKSNAVKQLDPFDR